MPPRSSRVVARAILLPLIALATTLTGAQAAAGSPPGPGHTAFKTGHGQAHVSAHHIASLESLNGRGLSTTPPRATYNKPAPAGMTAAAPSRSPGPEKAVVGAAGRAGPAVSVRAPTNAPISGGTFTSFVNGVDSSQIPPDSAIAVGPFQVVVAVNTVIKVFNRNGTLTSGSVSDLGLNAFFGPAPGSSDNLFDPRLFFDPQLGRFWLLATSENDSSGPGDTNRSTFLVALSDGSDALQGWNVYGFDATVDGSAATTNWCDYPMLGVDADDIFLSCNMFNFPSTATKFQYAKVRVMSKSQFTNVPNTCCSWDDFFQLPGDNSNNPFAFTVQPAREYGASSADGEWLVNAHLSCNLCTPHTLEVWHITSGPSGLALDHTGIDVGKFPTPTQARQPGGPNNIDINDGRLQFAFWKAGRLSTGQTMGCNNNPADCAAFTQLDVSGGLSNLSAVNDFEVADDGQDRFYPAADVNAAGDITMVYSLSGPATFLSTDSIAIPHDSACTSGTCSLPPEQILAGGSGDYQQFDTSTPPRNRWGDYFAAAADPDGTGVWVQGQFSGAGNIWETVVGLTREAPDTTPPTTTAVVAPTPVSGWNRSSVIVTLNASDAESGVQSITYSVSGAESVPPTTVSGSVAFIAIASEGISTVKFQATDDWGNQEAANSLPVRIDETGPNTSCIAQNSVFVWYATDQLASCTATDTLSGLGNAADASFTLTTSVPAGTETASAFTNTHVVCDLVGNCTTAGPVGPFMIDKKPPDIKITSPTASTYTLHQVVPVGYGCTDGGSGVASCAGPVPSGGNLDTSTAGVHTFTVNAADNVGNQSQQTITYRVTYAVCLLYDASKVHTPGSYSFRFELCDANGADVSTSAVTVTATDIEPGHIVPQSTSSPTNAFSFDPMTGSYVYVLSTKGLPPNSYQLSVTASGDPIGHTLPFVIG